MLSNLSSDLVIPCGLVFASWVLIKLWNRRNRIAPPPGPSYKDIDPKALSIHPWLVFHKWSLKYGPLFSYSVFGKRTIVINSSKVVLDLLEGRSNIYSDRPFNWMSGELANRKNNVFQASTSNPRFKQYRRLLHNGLNPRAARDYRPIQLEELRTMMKEFSTKPQDFKQSIRRNAVAVILKVAYGYPMGGYDDEFVKIVEDGFEITATLMAPGRWLVEFFPFLRFLPEWTPGAGFIKYAREIGDVLKLVDLKPFKWAQEQIEKGDYVESFTSKQLQGDTSFINPDEKEDVVRWVSAALYAGGADTTVAALTTFFYVMQLNTDMQKKAQREIDELTGGNRLPTLDDYDSLPYVKAMLKEIIRWAPVAPLGLTHRVTTDDIYEGYLIPKGSKVIANIWAITHDPELYPDPFVFDPERHLGETPQSDPFKYIFGFGRRVCPGAHLAEMSLILNIINILATFNIAKAKDPQTGAEIEPVEQWTTGITTHLESFPCDIQVRSPELLASFL